MTHFKREYIGDGVYASFDGYHIWLETERDGGVHRIALEPEVFQGLVNYKDYIVRQLAAPDRDDAEVAR